MLTYFDDLIRYQGGGGVLLTYVFYFDDVECLSFIWMERVKSAIKKLIYDTKDAFFFAWVRDSYYIFSRGSTYW